MGLKDPKRRKGARVRKERWPIRAIRATKESRETKATRAKKEIRETQEEAPLITTDKPLLYVAVEAYIIRTEILLNFTKSCRTNSIYLYICE